VRYVLGEIVVPLLGMLLVGLLLGWLTASGRRSNRSTPPDASHMRALEPGSADATVIEASAGATDTSRAPIAPDVTAEVAPDVTAEVAPDVTAIASPAEGEPTDDIVSRNDEATQLSHELDELRWALKERDARIRELEHRLHLAAPGRAGGNQMTDVWGITPEVEKLLEANGVRSVGQLSQLSVGELEDVLQTGGPAFADLDPSSWPRQAALLVGSSGLQPKSQSVDN
jgi:predicted flap endonuclease-1-like 5' DNA nuclease